MLHSLSLTESWPGYGKPFPFHSQAWAEITKVLAAKNLPPNLFNHLECPPLFAAVHLKDLELCKKFIEWGNNVLNDALHSFDLCCSL